MNLKEYQNKRKTMINEIEELIAKGEVEEAKNKMEEVEKFDNDFDNARKAKADLEALNKNEVLEDIENKSENVEGGKVMDELHKVVNQTEVYANAWAKSMLGQDMTKEEKQIHDKVNNEFRNANSYTHTTQNTPEVIPETVVAGIFRRIEEENSFYRDIKKYNVRGKLTITKHDSIDDGDAAVYDEDTETDDQENTFATVDLDGYDVAKQIRVSWRLKAMSVQEFLSFIEEELADRIGVKLGDLVVNGTGTNEPQGALAEISGGASEIDGATKTGFEAITSVIAKVHSSYLQGAKFYASTATIYNDLIHIVDANGRPFFQNDLTGQYAGRMLGFPVEVDGAVAEHKVLFGNANKGYVGNINEPLSVKTQDDIPSRTTIYGAYMVFDGDVTDTSAFASLKEADKIQKPANTVVVNEA